MPLNAFENDTPDCISVAILGAGHAGRGLAGYLSLQGVDVSLFNRTRQNIEAIIKKGGISVHGIVRKFAPISIITDNIARAIQDRDIIIITVPAQAHKFFAQEIAPHLESDQTLLLMPGRTGGALEFTQTLRAFSGIQDVLVGEAQTFSFVSRISRPNEVLISKVKNSVHVSAFPAMYNDQLMKRLNTLPLPFHVSDSVLETSINNVGALLHPTPTILCAGIIESKGGSYNHYHDAISPSVGRLIERMDYERVLVAEHFDVTHISAQLVTRFV